VIPLTLLPSDEDGRRAARDRLELLTTLIAAPSFDPLYRDDIIHIPRQHPVFGYQCQVPDCEAASAHRGFCMEHKQQWRVAEAAGQSRMEFIHTAAPLLPYQGMDYGTCRICPERPAKKRQPRLCWHHLDQWKKLGAGAECLQGWAAAQEPLPGFGSCRVTVCPYGATSPIGLCTVHEHRYKLDNRPGRASLPWHWHQSMRAGTKRIVAVSYTDERLFRQWCATAEPARRTGVINLVGLQPLVKAEIKWGMFAHALKPHRTRWDIPCIQQLASTCRAQNFTSVFDTDADGHRRPALRQHPHNVVRMISGEIVDGLRLVYYSPLDTRDAGFIETDHFGRRFVDSVSYYDISGVSQRWLRDMLWDHLAEVLRSQHCPRRRGTFGNLRRAALELSAFLELEAPNGGHDPGLLGEEHAHQFVADQRHRARHGLPSLSLVRKDGTPAAVTIATIRMVFNHIRKLCHWALLSGLAEQIRLDAAFINVLPHGGTDPKPSRNPFSDEVARALADTANLERLAALDLNDRGARDIWETIVYTGRRGGEVRKLRLDCIGRYRGLAMLWHDQTKVGNYNEAIRIPEVLYDQLNQRRAKTLRAFEDRRGRGPTLAERDKMALFPGVNGNRNGDRSVSSTFFSTKFKRWVEELALGTAVAHQARHTLATNLLRAGASLAHIRRYLGQVSDRMAEHYAKVAHSDLEDVLHAVWVAGPGAANPGALLSTTTAPLSREEALALAVDLSRRSTPADGGFCTFQPVVDGGACPWKLDCENCDKFALSGADLLYWRRKQEQWRSIAERAPDDTTADYLHQVFEPTARAIEGLEKALAGVGLLDQALALDLRRPQDYFHRIWSTNFRAADLAAVTEDDDRRGPSTEDIE
jgi:integrase